jgi:hypothetical protein
LPKPALPFTVSHESRNVTTVRMEAPSTAWEAWLLLRSDAHHDNPHCDWTLERKHLEQAKERNALIIDAGDLHCSMQAREVRQAGDKSNLRPEHQSGDYLDKLVKTAADFYRAVRQALHRDGQGQSRDGDLQAPRDGPDRAAVERINERCGSNIFRPAATAGGCG